jgi:hypothetical protein
MALGRRRWRRSTVGTGAYPETCWTGGRNEPRCDPRALAPPAPLKVTNSVVGTSGESWPWEGTVSPQGGVVLRSPRLSRIEGQIDARGTIRAQAPIAGGGTNRIIKFVWQKE